MSARHEWFQDLVDDFIDSVLGPRKPEGEPARIPAPVTPQDDRTHHLDDRF